MKNYSIPWRKGEATGIFSTTAQNEAEAKISFRNIMGHEVEISGEITIDEARESV